MPDLRYEDEYVAVVGSHPLPQSTLGVDALVVRTTNKLAEADPAGHWFVNQQVQEAMRRAAELGIIRNSKPLVGPEGRRELVASSEPSARLFARSAEDSAAPPGFDTDYTPTWREHVPSARALWPLQHPQAMAVAFDGAAPTSEVDRLFFAHVLDAVGIRSRAAVMSAALMTWMGGAENLRWLSLASGAAVPVVAAAQRLISTGVGVKVDLFDLDEEALRLASNLAVEAGIEGFVDSRVTNLFDLDDLARKAAENGGYDVVDILGFFEYLPDIDHESSNGFAIPSASAFLRRAMDLMNPGGMLVLSNMLTTHPQLDFVLRVVQWPYIRPRSLESLLGLIRRAGVDDDQVTLLLPDDGVYAVALIQS
jgi:hypothetical protein